MILITGTNLDVSQLPNNEMMDYQIDNERMNIKLKTVAKSPNCFQIYIAEDKQNEYTVTDELLTKIVYFKNDEELITLLENGVTSTEVDIFDDGPVQEESKVEVPEFEPPKIDPPKPKVDLVKEPEEEVKPSKSKGKGKDKEEKVVEEVKETEGSFEVNSNNEPDSIIPVVNIEDADTELPEAFLSIPNFGDDTDALKVQLENKDKLIAQKEAMIRELQKSMDEAYKVQEMQLREVEDMYAEKMAEAQETIKVLEKKAITGNLDESATRFLKYINYANSFKGVVSEGFTDEERAQMGTLTSNFYIFSCGNGDSSYSMLKQVKGLIDKGSDSVIIDFSNDNFLAASYKLNSKTGNSLSLLKDEINPVELLKDINGCKFIPTTSFNDIVFLSIDWVKLLKKINELASGKDVVLIFGNLSNFNVRSIVSRLATIGKLYVFAKCSPIILSALYSDTQFIPKERVNIVALEYIEVVKTILNAFSSNFNIKAYDKAVKWDELGIR